MRKKKRSGLKINKHTNKNSRKQGFGDAKSWYTEKGTGMNPVSEATFTFKSFCQFKGQDMDAMQKAMQYIFPKMTKLFFLIKKKELFVFEKSKLEMVTLQSSHPNWSHYNVN